MKVYFLIIILLQIFTSLSDYTYELIEELETKYIIFEIQDFNAFKIFKYIPHAQKVQATQKIFMLNFSFGLEVLISIFMTILKI